MAASDIDKMHLLLDNLYIELLHLIEQQVAVRTNIERVQNSGQLLLAKTRYVQGNQTVGIAQIPTENSIDFNALCRVVSRKSDFSVFGEELALEIEPPNKSKGFIEPLHWFGVLAPTSIRAAQQQFKKCVDLVVEASNIQRELIAVMNSIDDLKQLIQKTK